MWGLLLEHQEATGLIAVDVSGSMSAACEPVASAAWIVARAAALTDLETRTATITYDMNLTALTRPTHRAPDRVTTFNANGGNHNLGDAIDALDQGLNLSRPGTGHLIVIVTDARYTGDETAQAVTRINRLIAAGCAVLRVTRSANSLHPPGTTPLHLPRPSSAPAAIAKAATDTIRPTPSAEHAETPSHDHRPTGRRPATPALTTSTPIRATR